MSGKHPHKGILPKNTLSPWAKRLRAMTEILIEKGVCTREELEREMEAMEKTTPINGARVVAKAWTDPAFKERLLSNPRPTLAELGYGPTLDPHDDEAVPGPLITILENTETVHNVIVCTLCSCYPQELLGRPPDWYRDLAYRQRIVRDPRGVLQDFGMKIPSKVEVRVADSTADLRFMVLPRRPEGTEGMSETELVDLVTRNSMVGTGQPKTPRKKTKASKTR